MSIDNLPHSSIETARTSVPATSPQKTTNSKITGKVIAGASVLALAAFLAANRTTMVDTRNSLVRFSENFPSFATNSFSYGQKVANNTHCLPHYTAFHDSVTINTTQADMHSLNQRMGILFNNATDAGKNMLNNYGLAVTASPLGMVNTQVDILICQQNPGQLLTSLASDISSFASSNWKKIEKEYPKYELLIKEHLDHVSSHVSSTYQKLPSKEEISSVLSSIKKTFSSGKELNATVSSLLEMLPSQTEVVSALEKRIFVRWST